MLIIDIPEALRERLGSEGSRALAELLNEAARQMRSDIILLAEERFERRLSEELAKIRVELGTLESRLREEMRRLQAAVDERIREFESRMGDQQSGLLDRLHGQENALIDRMAILETRLVRWAFGFWLGQFAALIAILFAFFRH